MAYQSNELNADLLANKVGEMLSSNESIVKIGGLNATRMIYVTAILGGIVGGFGAMTELCADDVLSKGGGAVVFRDTLFRIDCN